MRLLLWLACGAGSVASAFEISPLVNEFVSPAPGAAAVVTVRNPGAERIAVGFEITSRTHDARGRESREPVSDFSVSPDRVSLAPGESRRVRVIFKNGEITGPERAFRFVATQWPVDFKKGKPQPPKVLLQIAGSVYLRAKDTAGADIKVTKIERRDDRHLRVTVENTGAAHGRPPGPLKIRPAAGGDALPLTGPADLGGENILAGERREIDVETAAAVPEHGDLQGVFDNPGAETLAE